MSKLFTTVEGILMYMHDIYRIPKNPVFAKQGLTISGFGFEHFDSCIDSLSRTHTAALSMLPEGMQVSDWLPTEYGGYTALTFSNRLFSRACHAKGVDLVPFNSDVDPKGIMRDITLNKQSDLVHSDDNTVHYYKKVGRTTGTTTRYMHLEVDIHMRSHSSTYSDKFQPVNPRMIHVGDLVEIQFSIVAFPGTKGKLGILKPVLRSIAVLDSSIREVRDAS